GLVPLSTVAKISNSLGPMSINHLGQLPAVTISFNLKPGVSLGQAVDQVNEASRKILPDTVTTSFQGTAQAFESSFKGLGTLLLMAIAVIYIVLGVFTKASSTRSQSCRVSPRPVSVRCSRSSSSTSSWGFTPSS